jgi:hypothetical protein
MEYKKKITKNQAIKEAKEMYISMDTEWTEKEFIEDYLESLRQDGYLKT